MILRGTAILFAAAGMTAWLAGCGTGTQPNQSQPTQTISVQFFNTPPTSLAIGSAVQLSASVQNSASNLNVSWSVTCGTANACGSFSPTTSSNAAYTTYTAPSTVPTGGSVTVMATSVADPTKSVSTTIAITTMPPVPIAVTFYDPPPSSIQPGNTVSVSAQVVNDPAATPLVDWTASCSLSQCGTFSLNPSGSKISTFYTAPPSAASSTIISLKATSVTDPSKFVSAPVSIQLPIAVAFYQLPPSAIPTGTSAPISAHISNDVSANPQVTWSVTCNSSACGSFNTTTTGDEVSTTYTAPSAVPIGGSVSVTATSVTDSTKSVSVTIPIVARVPNSLLPDGNYVYRLYGGDKPVVVGVFVAAGGYIVGGEQDSLSSQDPNTSLYGTTLDRISGGSYTTSADGFLQIKLQFVNDGSVSFQATPAPHGKGFISGETSNGGKFSGTLNLQTSTAPPAGGYAVALQGDNGAGASWAGGILNIDTPGGPSTPGAFSGTGSELDFRSSSPSSLEELMISPGTVSIPDQYGRVVIYLVFYVPNTTAGMSAYLAGYSIDGVHMPLIETSNYYMVTDNYPYTGASAEINGIAIAQGAATGKFTANSLAGSSYVFGGSGYVFQTGNLPGYTSLMAGVITADSKGNISGTFSSNNSLGQSTSSPQPFTGTYTVDAEGRVNISNLSTTVFGSNLFLYLTGNGQGFVLSNNPVSVFQGEALEQQATPFSAASFSGTYGLNSGNFPFLASGEDLIGSITATSMNGLNTFTGSGETPKLTGNQVGTTDFSISGSFTPASNGVFQGTITGANLSSPATPGNFTLYLVDDTQGFAIQSGNATPTLVQLQVP